MYDIANGLTYTTAWSDDGSKYTVQLQCPPPEGTPTVALGNHYGGALAPRNLVGNNVAHDGDVRAQEIRAGCGWA